MKRLLITVLLLSVASWACGKERWAVKTLQDARPRIDLRRIHNTTIENLRLLPAPANLHQPGRLAEAEHQVYRVTAVLVGYKKESDEDFHIVLADPMTGSTLIGELPSPHCMPQAAKTMARLRAHVERLARKHKVNGLYRPAKRTLVSVNGVGFFDFLHGQTGVAPNGIELHPILGLE